MARKLSLALVAIAALLLGACASAPRAADGVVAKPKFEGIYRLAFSNSGQALYYRFFSDGTVLSARSDAPVSDVIGTLSADNADTSRGTWTSAGSEIKVGVNEGTVWYDSRFDIRSDGRIALHNLPRAFEYIPLDGKTAVANR